MDITPELLARVVLDNADYGRHVARLIQENPALAVIIADALEGCALEPDSRDFSVLKLVAAQYLRDGTPMPEWLRKFAAGALDGSIAPAPRAGRPRTTIMRDFALWGAVAVVADVFGMPRYSNAETRRSPTAAEVVAQVSHVPIDKVIHACRQYQNLVPPILGAKNTP